MKLPNSVYNPISALGAAVAFVTGLLGALLLGLSFVLEELHNPYFGIFLYLVLPAVLFAGLLLIPIGMVRARHRRTEGRGPAHWPVVDLSRPGHRNAVLVFLAGTAVLLTVSGIGSYEAFHYSESVEFCGTTCHQVMEPEYTTYQHSPHARVSCSACHIGEGADWWVKAKLSGAYQVYATLTDRYPRPIPTPVENLRPAQETCERCHWPKMFFGGQQRRYSHYLYDDDNTPWTIDLLIKTGGGDPARGQASGIHWHMNIGAKVEYIARDDERSEMPWVRVTDRRTGAVTVYQDESNPLTEEEIAAAEPRVMDCMDCHNRPSHVYLSPDEAIDLALRRGAIDRDLPGIKRLAVTAMAAGYGSKQEALSGIATVIISHYREKLPEVYERRRARLDEAVEAVQQAYASNVFPAMNAQWSDYPTHAGHFDSIGCMRCHTGNHVSEDGHRVTASCEACHVILAQGDGAGYEAASIAEGLEFRHPVDIAEMWREVGCWECHQGVQP